MSLQKSQHKYTCQDCAYSTCNIKDYNKHLNTRKHQHRTKQGTNRTEKSPKEYVCDCGKKYMARNSLWYHKKSCNGVLIHTNDSIQSLDSNNLVAKLLQENKEMREAMIQQHEQHNKQLQEHSKQIQELIPKLQQVTTINNQTNNNTTNNNKFNLNFFLNEQCKDAISIQTFIENLDIGIKELEHMGNVGYLQGMMTIMSNTLGAMDVYKRPVHCTDLKRETVYIKDGDTWKKDNANNDDLRRVINTVANVNYRNLDVWESQHPDAFESDTPDNIEYCKIAMESLGGYDNSDDKIAIKLNKLVKHVVREVYVK
jgi:hypothetical protein